MKSTWLRDAIIKEVIVYKSLSHNIWSNLALEDWILHNVDLSKKRILFMWRSSPVNNKAILKWTCKNLLYSISQAKPFIKHCAVDGFGSLCTSFVVIGRHQNPWLEANIPLIRERNIALARRVSGGGTVYHDLGNLNLTVFTHRTDYNRPRNLQLVCDVMNERWGTLLHVNKKDDIIYDRKWKVSGSAARLMKDSTYHHFTLLLQTDLHHLAAAIKPHPSISVSSSTATASVRSEVTNICTLHPDVTHEGVVEVVADRFYQIHGARDTRVVEVDPSCDRSCHLTYSGLAQRRSDLQEWDWIYGKTPPFSFQSEIEIEGNTIDLHVRLGKGGIVEDCRLVSRETSNDEYLEICASLKGVRWKKNDVTTASQQWTSDGDVAGHVVNSIISLT